MPMGDPETGDRERREAHAGRPRGKVRHQGSAVAKTDSRPGGRRCPGDTAGRRRATGGIYPTRPARRIHKRSSKTGSRCARDAAGRDSHYEGNHQRETAGYTTGNRRTCRSLNADSTTPHQTPSASRVVDCRTRWHVRALVVLRKRDTPGLTGGTCAGHWRRRRPIRGPVGGQRDTHWRLPGTTRDA